MGRVVVLVLVFFIFCKAGFGFAENSAMFHITTTGPPSAQAGKEITFEIGMTNTGIETWVAGEYSVFLKVYDANKNYLTETDRIRQFKDNAPAEALAANISFDIPVDYSGTYHYRVGMELEEETLFSHYFILKVLPFVAVPEVKRWTGNIQIGYQDSKVVEPTTSLNLRVVNLLPEGRYLKFSTSGRSTPSIDPELSNFLVSYHSQKLDLSAGDFATGLSELTLSRSRGIKVGTRLGEVNLVGLVGSSQKVFKDDLYGLGGSLDLDSNLTLGANYIQDKNGQNSVVSLEAEFALSPEITLSGEYAWSSYEGGGTEQEIGKGSAFRIAASAYSEKLALDGSYEKADQNFFFLSNPSLSGGGEEYDLCVDYSFTDYISSSLYCNQYYEDSPEEGGIFRYSLADASLSFFLPKLPSLSIAYDISENFSNEDSEVLIDDTTHTFTVGISYPIKKVRLSISNSRSDYEDRTELPSRETTVSNTYGISAPWGKHLVLMANYGTSDAEDLIALNMTKYRHVTFGVEYKIIPDKLSLSTQYKMGRKKDSENTIDSRTTTTNLMLSYYPSKENVVQLRYIWTDEDNFLSASAPISDRKNIYLVSRYNLTKGQSIELRYSLINGGDSTGGTASSENESIHLTYNYRF